LLSARLFYPIDPSALVGRGSSIWYPIDGGAIPLNSSAVGIFPIGKSVTFFPFEHVNPSIAQLKKWSGTVVRLVLVMEAGSR